MAPRASLAGFGVRSVGFDAEGRRSWVVLRNGAGRWSVARFSEENARIWRDELGPGAQEWFEPAAIEDEVRAGSWRTEDLASVDRLVRILPADFDLAQLPLDAVAPTDQAPDC